VADHFIQSQVAGTEIRQSFPSTIPGGMVPGWFSPHPKNTLYLSEEAPPSKRTSAAMSLIKRLLPRIDIIIG
jgi:hypothetical protein